MFSVSRYARQRFRLFQATGFGLAASLLSCVSLPALAARTNFYLTSPDRQISVKVTDERLGELTYGVGFHGNALLGASDLGLITSDDRFAHLRVLRSKLSKGVDRYTLNGPASRVEAAYNEMTLEVADPDHHEMTIVFRAYNDGVAFRYLVPRPSDRKAIAIRGERTSFHISDTEGCFASPMEGFPGSHEGTFSPINAANLNGQNFIDAPLMCKTATAAFALAESDVVNYAGSYFKGTIDGVGINLSPRPDENGDAVAYDFKDGPLKSPWRVVMIGETPGKLIESTLIYTLATPAASVNWDWVRPGKAAWDWWSGYAVDVAHPGPNSETEKAFIDFAHQFAFPYMLIDDGWYEGSNGGGQFKPTDNITVSKPEMDIPALVTYGRERGVGILLWVHWKALDRQMDAAMTQFEAWGVKGIKVDFMDRNDQDMVAFYHRVLETAAQHHLMVDLHGAYPPNGLARTYPNFVTQEAVRGAEVNKWWGGATAEHNVNLAYTRLLLGPADYTPGGFRNLSPEDFAKQVRSDKPFVQTTRAHALGLFVVMLSPLMTVADSPDVYIDKTGSLTPGADFIKAVPTTWDETRFVAGDVGEYVAIARRKGGNWTVGILNGKAGHDVTIPLSFLGKGRFTAKIYADGPKPDTLTITSKMVASKDSINLTLAAAGGVAIQLTPIH